MNHQTKTTRSGIKPGAILRAMGAEPTAVTPESFDPPHLRGAAHATADRPRIEIVRDGERVLKILAHCSCGEVIAIECDYAEGREEAALRRE
jgi:hypothetical protein